MARRVLTVALGVFVATSAVSQDAVTREASGFSAAALQAQRQAGHAPLVVDVRTPDEYASGHIPGAPLAVGVHGSDRRKGRAGARVPPAHPRGSQGATISASVAVPQFLMSRASDPPRYLPVGREACW